MIENCGVLCRLPAETRWCSYGDSFECFMKNVPIIKKLLADQNELKVKQDVVNDVFNDELVNHVK